MSENETDDDSLTSPPDYLIKPRPAVASEKTLTVDNVQSMPTRLLELAISKDADIDKLQQLMELQERFEEREARKAYYRARSHFQSIVPMLKKTKKGYNDYWYTPLGDIATQIAPSLSKCGLSYRFDFKQEHGALTVACIVTHEDGYSERTVMTGPADTTGNKNDIQSIGSSASYLQRYSLIAALGLATADQDIDGRIGPQTITDEQAASIKARLAEADADVAQFCAALGIADVDSMPPGKLARADALLTNRKKREAFINADA